MPDLLHKRLLFVTGKGGVGRTTVAAALGLLASRRGRRVIVAELAGQRRLARVLGERNGRPLDAMLEAQLAPGLWSVSIDPRHALEEYLRLQAPVGPLADVLASSRMFGYFAAATPGLAELLTVGKLWELASRERRVEDAQRYDLVVVDAPATGQSIAMLQAPQTFAEIARVGPIGRQAETIGRTLADRRFTGIVAVAIPEESPVNETLELHRRLPAEAGLQLDRVIVNGVYPDRFSADDCQAIDAALAHAEAAEHDALRAALAEHARAALQAEQLARLRAGLGRCPLLTLPFLFTAALGREQLERLVDGLDVAL